LNLKSDDLGRLNLRKHTIAKRSEYLAKRKDYEEKYISRYMKKRKAEPKRSSSKNLDHDLISGRLDLRAFVDKKRHEIKTERTEYEKKYISKYKESKASIKKSKSLTESDDLGKFTISTKTSALKKLRAERAEYEKQYLTRYSKQQKAKPKKKVASSDLYKPEIPKPKTDRRKERKEYEQKYLSRYKQPKSGVKKSSNFKADTDIGTLTLGQYVNAKRRAKQDEIREYEQKYLSRYKEPKTKKNVGSDLYKPEIPKPKIDMKKERKKYEQKYLSRYKQPKSGVKKSTSWTQHDVALGRLTLSPHFNAKRKAKQDEIREYEKQYLSRYKQPKANLRKPLNLKSDDLGRLNLRKHTIAKRSEYLAKRKDYEEKYILRYMKKLKAEPKRSSSKNLDHDLISGRLNLLAFVDKKRREIKTERTEYEKKYISKYKESKASIKKSKSLTESDDLGKFTISTKTTALKKLRAERAEYEKQYLTRYGKQQKAKPKPKKKADSSLYKPEIPKPKRDMKKERKEYEQKYLARHLKQRKTKPKKKK